MSSDMNLITEGEMARHGSQNVVATEAVGRLRELATESPLSDSDKELSERLSAEVHKVWGEPRMAKPKEDVQKSFSVSLDNGWSARPSHSNMPANPYGEVQRVERLYGNGNTLMTVMSHTGHDDYFGDVDNLECVTTSKSNKYAKLDISVSANKTIKADKIEDLLKATDALGDDFSQETNIKPHITYNGHDDFSLQWSDKKESYYKSFSLKDLKDSCSPEHFEAFVKARKEAGLEG